MMNEHKVILEETKEKYNELKKTMHELRAAEVSTFYFCQIIHIFTLQYTWHYDNNRFQLLGTMYLT